jgi:hypothetical protein
MALVWQQQISYISPMAAGGTYYYIQWPGLNAVQPSFFAYKGMPNDASGTMPPAAAGILPVGATAIGSYGSLAAAQSACSDDANPPIPPALHTDVQAM